MKYAHFGTCTVFHLVNFTPCDTVCNVYFLHKGILIQTANKNEQILQNWKKNLVLMTIQDECSAPEQQLWSKKKVS